MIARPHAFHIAHLAVLFYRFANCFGSIAVPLMSTLCMHSNYLILCAIVKQFAGLAPACFRSLLAVGAPGSKVRISLGLPVGAVLNCANNSGAKDRFVTATFGFGARLKRLPDAGVGNMNVTSVMKSKPKNGQ
ncbi:hypothetical protein BKA62DRAFT_717664 [Auriculariales sp. MPI-PUGE-AT-0066]|nr:hypothetical protein BKA62DRAFT_717664 [Auriculariales sp. MPI-PUGE-AT-0066]